MDYIIPTILSILVIITGIQLIISIVEAVKNAIQLNKMENDDIDDN